MKKLLALPTVLLLSTLGLLSATLPAREPATPATPATVYRVDGGHSSVIFRTRHRGIAYFYGAFRHVEGGVTYDETDPSKSSIHVKIDAASVDTRNSKRDDHVKSPDFLSAKEFPEIVFESTSVKADDDGLKVTGELTLRGVKRTVEADVEVVAAAAEYAGFEAVFTIDMLDFGFDWIAEHEGALGPDVRVIVSLETVK
jgi:polyisoprenoid-binding protein YceI